MKGNPAYAVELLEAIPDLVFLINQEGRYLAWGGQKDGLFLDPDSFIGKTMHEVFPDSWADYHLEKIRKSFREGRPLTYTYSLVVDTEQWFECRVVPSKVPEHVLVFVRNMTDYITLQQTLEERTELLEKSNGELANFAYIASHDLQEPLRTITSYLDILKDECGGKMTPDAEEAIGFVMDAATRMKDLIAGLLDYSRVESRGAELQPVDLQQLVEKVIHTTPTNGHTLNCQGLPKVNGDRNQLGQVFQNLIGNAIKYRKPNTEAEIDITWEGEEDGFHTIAVKDKGIGIEPQYFEQIFVIFKRLYPQHEYPGTGLGLAITKKIVERHRGSIWVESEPGVGSIFYVKLPEVSCDC